jgi:3-hydroxyisobutyrate dehydrogenase-like beta-hydroxyacid dehydrogenase
VSGADVTVRDPVPAPAPAPVPMRITVLGLGQLGLPLAAALVAAGHHVVGVDVDLQRRTRAQQHGVATVDPQAAADMRAVDWLVSVLPDDAALQAALSGASGDAAMHAADPRRIQLAAGGVHLCVGTISVVLAKLLAAGHAAQGGHFVAAPVFGRPDEAWARDLTALFGATPALDGELRRAALALVACWAPRVHAVDAPAAASAAKLAGNLMIASAVATMSEAFALAQAHGAPAALLHAVVTGKLFRGPVYEGVGRALARACSADAVATAEPGFTVRLGLKDLGLCQAAAQGLGLQQAVADAVRGRLQQAVARGHAERDWADLPALIKDLP